MPSHAEPIEETEKKKHARLPAQTPASRVSKNPGGNKRQERKRKNVSEGRLYVNWIPTVDSLKKGVLGGMDISRLPFI